MIKTLRKRFIRSAMLAVILVVAVLIGALLIGAYTSTRSELVSMLDMLSENEGRLPFDKDGKKDEEPPSMPEGEQQIIHLPM